MLAWPIIHVLFEHGAFGPDDTLKTSRALAAYAAGLPAYVLIKVLAPGFFAREDTQHAGQGGARLPGRQPGVRR